MSLPRFTAEQSCYRTGRAYGGSFAGRGISTGSGDVVVLAEEYACSSETCTCYGLPDCIDMFGGDACGPGAQCDSTDGLICRCLRP